MMIARWEIWKVTEYDRDGSVKRSIKLPDTIWLEVGRYSYEEMREIASEKCGTFLAATHDMKVAEDADFPEVHVKIPKPDGPYRPKLS